MDNLDILLPFTQLTPEYTMPKKKNAATTKHPDTVTATELAAGDEPPKPGSTEAYVATGRAASKEANPLDGVLVGQQINNWFQYHKPDDEQIDNIKRIRDAAKAYAQIIKDSTPNCADQSAAIRQVRESMMTANASIVCRGR